MLSPLARRITVQADVDRLYSKRREDVACDQANRQSCLLRLSAILLPISGGGEESARFMEVYADEGPRRPSAAAVGFYAALHMHISAIMSNISHNALNHVHERPVKSKATFGKKLDASHRLQQDDGKEKKLTLQHTHHRDTAKTQHVKQEKKIPHKNTNNAGIIRPEEDSKISKRVVDVPSKTNDPQSNNEGSKPSGILDVFINVKNGQIPILLLANNRPEQLQKTF